MLPASAGHVQGTVPTTTVFSHYVGEPKPTWLVSTDFASTERLRLPLGIFQVGPGTAEQQQHLGAVNNC